MVPLAWFLSLSIFTTGYLSTQLPHDLTVAANSFVSSHGSSFLFRTTTATNGDGVGQICHSFSKLNYSVLVTAPYHVATKRTYTVKSLGYRESRYTTQHTVSTVLGTVPAQVHLTGVLSKLDGMLKTKAALRGRTDTRCRNTGDLFGTLSTDCGLSSADPASSRASS